MNFYTFLGENWSKKKFLKGFLSPKEVFQGKKE